MVWLRVEEASYRIFPAGGSGGWSREVWEVEGKGNDDCVVVSLRNHETITLPPFSPLCTRPPTPYPCLVLAHSVLDLVLQS